MGLIDELFEGREGGHELSSLLSEMPTTLPNVSRMIDDVLSRGDIDNYGGLKMKGYHPSFIASRECVNAYYYHVTEEREEEFENRTLRIFHNGDDVHTRLQRYMSEYLYGTWKCRDCRSLHNVHTGYYDWLEGISSESDAAVDIMHRSRSLHSIPAACPETCLECGGSRFKYAEWRVIDPKMWITGKMDGVFMNGMGEFIGWEIKSANANSFRSLSATSNLMLKYKKQFSIYLTTCGFRDGIITVECKDNQELKDYHVYAPDVDLSAQHNAIKVSNNVLSGADDLPDPRRGPECPGCLYLHAPCDPTR